jgi:uncharacterized membrane protein YjgN (DUF898 family)
MGGWMHAVTRVPLPLSLSVIVALSVIVPWLAVRGVRRLWPYHALEKSNELVGFSYAIFGLIYGVLLAYTIVVAWERFAETERIVMRESTVLSELWRDSESFPPEIRTSIHRDLASYTESVVENEWPTMGAQGTGDARTIEVYERLWSRSYQIEPQTKNQVAFLEQYLQRMNDLSSLRLLRILYSRTEVQSILWVVLLMGSVMTVGYTLLLSGKQAWIQTTVTACIMLMVMLGLFVILSLQYPFSGDVSVKPEAFHDLLNSFQLRMLPMRVLLR